MNSSPRHKFAHAGKCGEGVRSDCYVEIKLRQTGGLDINLRSKVAAMYGEAIRELAVQVVNHARIAHAEIFIDDSGALPFTLHARLETAVQRLLGDVTFEYHPIVPAVQRSATVKHRMRRSRLYLPGNEPKFFINAGLHQPDAVILDLEDSVAPEEKDAARNLVKQALRQIDFRDAEIMVRINPGELGRKDLLAIVPHGVQVILVPKCESAQTIVEVMQDIEKLRREHKLTQEIFLIPIIESALGVIKAFEIGSASDRVCALAIGLEDYTADLGVQRTVKETESLFAKSMLVNAARAAGIHALASVYAEVDNTEGLRQNVLAAKTLGFAGMGCIHPRQIKIIHEAFAPSVEEINQAQKIVFAFERAQQKGLGVIALGTKMIDMPIVKRAQTTLAHALHAGLISPDWREHSNNV